MMDDNHKYLTVRDKAQKIILTWAVNTFGGEVASNPHERVSRFIEEAIELAQATKEISEEDVIKLVKYVFSRPVGDIEQEVGGVMVSLMALCEFNKLSLEGCELVEMGRVLRSDPDGFRAKQAAKATAGVAKEIS